MNSNFKKEDLRTGMRVTTKNGNKYIVLLNDYEGKDRIANNYCLIDLDCFTENLKDEKYQENNIVKVEKPKFLSRIFEYEDSSFEEIWSLKDYTNVDINDLVNFIEDRILTSNKNNNIKQDYEVGYEIGYYNAFKQILDEINYLSEEYNESDSEEEYDYDEDWTDEL